MTDATSKLTIRGARTHNLADITVALPRNRLSVITGPSGSGKSSLVFHTIYAESQRRYIEALSSFARQFLDRLPRPDVDLIEGLSPAICVRQQVPGRSPRSTVGTATEVYDYLRLLYARVGQAFCPTCGREVRSFSPQQVAEEVLTQTAGQRFSVLAPLGSRNQQEIKSDLKRLRKEGFVRVLIDGCVRDLGRDVHLGASSRHELEVVIDRLSVSDGARRRLTEAVELAYAQSQGRCKVAFREGDSQIYSEGYACAEHGPVLPELSPRLFSFNDRLGACDACAGLGRRREFCIESVIPDESRSLAAGAVVPWGTPSGSFYKQMLKSMEASIKVNLDQPFNQLSADERALVLHGNPRFEGVLPGLHRRLRDYEQKKRREGAGEEEVFEYLEAELGQYSVWTECSVCHGSRLGVAAQSVQVQGMTIAAACRLSLRELLEFLGSLSLSGIRAQIAERIVRELADRLRFLEDVGVGYLSLDRSIASLSSGESQRVRLATQIGASFVGALYVLDEPSAGLHPRDMQRLWQTLLRLRDRGNTVLVVEHDETAIRAADHIVDMGPGAGSEGGRIVAQGVPKDVAASVGSPTGDFLAGRRSIAVPEQLRVAKEHIEIVSASTHNLREVNVRIPIGCLTCVTGVSGSGKSSLVMN
ncbi:MAG: excinuclease ABC subunit UvrA, partial [Myxococcota bacterium]